MSEPLQPFDFKKSQYERPNQAWACGRQCEGTACELGPSAKGDCRGQRDCTPAKEGDRYLCTRDAVRGGKCAEGPLPDGRCCQMSDTCQPVLTLFQKRKRLTISVTALALAICFVIFGGRSPGKAMSPGGVISPHSTFENNCAACHHAAELESAWSDCIWDEQHPFEDSQLCMNCHHELGENHLNPHSVPPNRLAEFREQLASKPDEESVPFLLRLAKLTDAGVRNQQEITCAACHKEHHGQNFNLAAMNDLQCQVCHERQFDSFAGNHPEIGGYLYQQRTSIAFDHARHFHEYFTNDAFKRLMPEGKAPQSCNSCHGLDSTTGTMTTVSYEVGCGSCHDVDLEDRDFPTMIYLSLPAIDAEAPALPDPLSGIESIVTSAESTIGALTGRAPIAPVKEVPPLPWPRKGGPDRPLDFLTRILIGSSESGQQLIQRWHDSNASASDSELRSQMQVEFRNTLSEIVTKGPIELDRRIAAALGDRMGTLDLSQLTQRGEARNSLYSVLVQANDVWFGASSPEHNPAPQMSTNSNGWYFSAEDQTIRYYASVHADPVLTAWLNLLTQAKSDPAAKTLWELLAQPAGSGAIETMPLATGRCLSCHSVDETASGGLQIHWRIKPHNPKSRPFTYFSHSPHITAMGDDQCATCHMLDSSASPQTPFFSAAYFERTAETGILQPTTDPHQSLSSGFKSLTKLSCVGCHNHKTVHDACLDCHHYHVTEPDAPQTLQLLSR